MRRRGRALPEYRRPLLVEVDARTGFTDHLVHADGQVTRSAELKRHLLYVITAEATNMGLGEMAASAEISDEALAWTAEWYFRPETLEAASGNKQQNALTSVMKEYGMLRRTIYAALDSRLHPDHPDRSLWLHGGL